MQRLDSDDLDPVNPPAVVQRWRDRRTQYRPAGEVICTRQYEVAPLARTAAKSFVTAHHYSGAFPAARYSYGLYRRDVLCGACVFSHPCRDDVLTSVPAIEAVELGRFVLLDDVPGNGETWFLSRAFTLLKRESIAGIVSFSDPVPRSQADGQIIFPGHIGTIYQAHNGCYLGRSKRQTLHLLPDGTVMSARAISKIRALDRGYRYSAEILEQHGADPFDVNAPAAWLTYALHKVCRRLRHGGNHKYAWGLDRAMIKYIARMSDRRAYPKQRG